MDEVVYCGYSLSPIGLIEIKSTQEAITSLYFVEAQQESVVSCDLVERAVAQITAYFAGERQVFDLPLAPAGTNFQRAVWQQLTQVPYGKTVSYLDIACALDNPRAIRAVGGANGRNPISIILPCHRIIGSNGKLIGYGGGLWRKEWLLRHERALLV